MARVIFDTVTKRFDGTVAVDDLSPDNLAFGLRNFKVPKPEIDARVRNAAEILEMTELIKRKPKQLSGGQRHASPSAGRSSASRRPSSWTSPSRTSTRPSAWPRAPRS